MTSLEPATGGVVGSSPCFAWPGITAPTAPLPQPCLPFGDEVAVATGGEWGCHPGRLSVLDMSCA